MASQVLFNGDWYQCIEAATAGQSPATHPDKWTKQAIPAVWERVLISLATAELLLNDGQHERAGREERRGVAILQETQHRDQQSLGFLIDSRPTVGTR